MWISIAHGLALLACRAPAPLDTSSGSTTTPATPTTGTTVTGTTVTGTTTGSGRWVWGDVHAHSRWSFDGCEAPEDLCRPLVEGQPASAFFSEAAARGLDFAALTDHAEASAWLPTGDGGASLDVWQGQVGSARAAEGGPVLPLVGYEWTWQPGGSDGGGNVMGGHRTVLLSELTDCAALRLPADDLGGRAELADGSTYLGPSGALAPSPADLWTGLAEASTACPTRWLTFAHHPAVRLPQPVDWDLAENAATPEVLLEILSEHGSSECAVLSDDGCTWRVNPALGLYADGSARAALDRGLHLGFLAGTDAHDARPGSVEDGPSAVGYWGPDPLPLYVGGGITGVWVGGDLTRDALFDGLEARRTVATSGPRPPALAAWVEDSAGARWPPGAAVQGSSPPLRVLLSGAEHDTWIVEAVDLITTDGATTVEAAGVDLPWPDGADWAYLRVRYAGDERVFVSPWRVD